MAKCRKCGEEHEKFYDCGEVKTGTEPQEVAKIELTEEQREDLAGANEQDHLRTRCYEEIERIINTAVNAERDRIMAVLPEEDNKLMRTIEVKKIVQGAVNEEVKG